MDNKPGRGIADSGDGADLGGLERFFRAERRENRWQALGELCLAGAGRADHEDIVAARCGDFESTHGGLLTAHIFEVGEEVPQLAEKLFSL